jgi:hypothetical protein
MFTHQYCVLGGDTVGMPEAKSFVLHDGDMKDL